LQAPLDAIRGTVEALSAELDVCQLFGGAPSRDKYRLRSVVCYFGHHYQAFVYSAELSAWLLADDVTIRLVRSCLRISTASR
jgi:ubiquitin C-terminal hydrolase